MKSCLPLTTDTVPFTITQCIFLFRCVFRLDFPLSIVSCSNNLSTGASTKLGDNGILFFILISSIKKMKNQEGGVYDHLLKISVQEVHVSVVMKNVKRIGSSLQHLFIHYVILN